MYNVNDRFYSILTVGLSTYILDFVVRGVILYGIEKKHPFVRALGIYMTMQITIMTQTGLILMILVFRYNAAGEYCSKGALK